MIRNCRLEQWYWRLVSVIKNQNYPWQVSIRCGSPRSPECWLVTTRTVTYCFTFKFGDPKLNPSNLPKSQHPAEGANGPKVSSLFFKQMSWRRKTANRGVGRPEVHSVRLKSGAGYLRSGGMLSRQFITFPAEIGKPPKRWWKVRAFYPTMGETFRFQVMNNSWPFASSPFSLGWSRFQPSPTTI